MPSSNPIDALLRGERLGIDVRAPVEFQRSCAPQSINLPLLTDAERERIGITYKQQGQEAAVKLGHKLVHGPLREARIEGWRRLATLGPDPLLYCARGGLRSQLVESWLAESGTRIERLPGGYQAVRSRCLELLEQFPRRHRLLLLGGRTGTGKTVVLKRLPQYIDLEGHAQHRGSAFGEIAAQQPTPATFTNRLAAATLKLEEQQPVVLEDESRTIGRLALPEDWFAAMKEAPIVQLESSIDERVQHITLEYIKEPLQGGQAPQTLEQRYLAALSRIQKRLGGKRYQELRILLREGFRSGAHEAWIRTLLEQYYDPSYDYQLERKHSRIVFRGNAEEVVSFLTQAS